MKPSIMHPAQSPRWYTSKEVALILNTDEWRIRNFGSKLYGLAAQVKSPGSGNRKRYSFEVVLKLAVADELYGSQLSPAGIKAALDLIRRRKLTDKWAASDGSPIPEMVLALDANPVLPDGDGQVTQRLERVWKVVDSDEAVSMGQDLLARGAVALLLDLAALWTSVVQRIIQLEADESI